MTKEQLFIQLVERLSHEKLFHGHAVIDAEDEAMMILMSIYNQTVDEVLTTGNDKVDSKLEKQAMQISQQRLDTLKPMAYLIGKVSFAGLEFVIDERALVPRSPIAQLIVSNFEQCLDMTKVNSVLDLCTGSGCIGISIAKKYQQIQCDISDISSKALSLAQENIIKHNVKANCIQSDLFAGIDATYDLIVSNPPYVSDDEYNELPKEYKVEPKLGLVSESDGLEIPVKILLQAPSYLNDEGYLIMEVGYSDKLLAASFPNVDFNWLEFSHGGQGVCVFTKKMLLEYLSYFKEFLRAH